MLGFASHYKLRHFRSPECSDNLQVVCSRHRREKETLGRFVQSDTLNYRLRAAYFHEGSRRARLIRLGGLKLGAT